LSFCSVIKVQFLKNSVICCVSLSFYRRITGSYNRITFVQKFVKQFF
jgi:hypothetical protein